MTTSEPPSKTCGRCHQTKPVAEFNLSSRNKDGRQYMCRTCQKVHYRKNAARHGQNVRRSARLRLQRYRAVLHEALSEGCIDCGFRDVRALEFDHVRGEKVANVSKLVRHGYSLEVVLAEIAKCEVRCKNCHAIATANRRESDWRFDYL